MAGSTQVRSFPEFESSSSATEAKTSGVTWSAVIAGAFVAMALALILLALGTGVGLSAGAFWSNAGSTGAAVGIGALIWLIVVEGVSSSVGGYIAGRLRTKWVSIHSHEVYFRDTAHGFLVWAVAVVATGALLGTAAASMAGGSAPANTAGEAPASVGARPINSNEYFADALFRTANPAALRNDPTAYHDEANLILLNGIRKGTLSNADTTYLGQLIAARTGMTVQESEQRATQVFSDDLAAAQAARSAGAHLLYWLFVALLVGAYCASHAATIGGRQRDKVRRAVL